MDLLPIKCVFYTKHFCVVWLFVINSVLTVDKNNAASLTVGGLSLAPI